jgi:hypothetical protein
MSPAAITTTPGSGTGVGDGAIVGVGATVGAGVGVAVATTVGIGEGLGVAEGALHAASIMRRAAAGFMTLRKVGAVPSGRL